MLYDLVFQGGGAKGIVFAGAVQEFKADGHTYDRLLGTSAGAITATLLAAGYNPEEMLEVLNEREDGKPVFASFMSTPTSVKPETLKNSALHELLNIVDFPFVPNFVKEKLDSWILETLAKRPRSRHMFSFIEHGGWFSAHKFLEWLGKN